MDADLTLRAAIYRHFVETGAAPTIAELGRAMVRPAGDIRDGWQRLAARRMLVLSPDGESIRMALPFSGVPTRHQARVRARTYFANCAWDTFGIPAALHAEAHVLSQCEQSGEPLRLHLGAGGPPPSDWRFHAAVPAVHWWRDIVYT